MDFWSGFDYRVTINSRLISGTNSVKNMQRSITHSLSSISAALSLLETLLDRSYDAVLVTDAATDQKIVYVNSAFEQLTGYSSEEVFDKSPKLLQGPSTDRTEIARLGNLIREGKSFEGQAVNYRKDGTPFMMSWRVEPVSVGSKLVAWVAIQRAVNMKWQVE
jgi:PAS domain S-box-containing protein